MKLLPSSLRSRKRYVAFRVYSDSDIKKSELVKEVWRNTIHFFGENIASDMNLWVMHYNNSQGFLVCGHKHVGKVKAVMTLINNINGKRVHIIVLGVSGTIKALKRKFLNKEVLFIKQDKGQDRNMKFMGKHIKTKRTFNRCIDIDPINEELVLRLNRYNMKYIGLTEEDLGGEKNATDA